MARSLVQMMPDGRVGSVAWVADDARPLASPTEGDWEEYAEFDAPSPGDVFSSACPIRYAPPFDADRYNVVQVNPDDGAAFWIYNTQGQPVSYDDGGGPAHWLNVLPTGTPNVFPPPTNWRKYEADGAGRAVWVQPSGAYDAYPQGFQVVSAGRLYTSLIPANTTQPGTDGGQFWRDDGEV